VKKKRKRVDVHLNMLFVTANTFTFTALDCVISHHKLRVMAQVAGPRRVTANSLPGKHCWRAKKTNRFGGKC
jgi:hypothetical protein